MTKPQANYTSGAAKTISAQMTEQGFSPLEAAAVLHGMADHTLSQGVIQSYLPKHQKDATAALAQWFEKTAEAVGLVQTEHPETIGFMSAELAGGHDGFYRAAQRILSTQDVSYGSTAMHRAAMPGPVSVPAITATLFALASDGIPELLITQIIDKAVLADAGDNFAPGATSLGRWYHRVADAIELFGECGNYA